MNAVVLFSRLVHPGLGDLVQRNIFLNQLQQISPDTTVTWVLSASVAASEVQTELVQSHSYADDVLFCPRPEDHDPAAMDEFRAQLAERGFSRCVIDPASIGLGARDAASAGIGTRIGVHTGADGDELITHPMRLGTGSPGLHDFSVALAEVIGIPAPAADAALARLPLRPEPLPGWATGRPLVGLHPGGAPGWNRRWPAAGFAELGARIADEYGATIVLVGAGEDAADIGRLQEAVLQRYPAAEVRPAVGLGLNSLVNLMDRLELLIGNDSAPAHLAAAVGTPTVVAYGPTSTDLVCGPVYPLHRGVSLGYACREQPRAAGLPGLESEEDEAAGQCLLGCPCFYNGPSTPAPRCLADITVESMWSAVTRQLPLS